MSPPRRIEASLVDTNNVLVALSELADTSLRDSFFGSVVVVDDRAVGLPSLVGKSVYLCGDISRVEALALVGAARVFVIKELSRDHEGKALPLVELGKVPIRVHGVGVYYRRFFDAGLQYFHGIRREHAFQSLTESIKPGIAHRTGIYLTPVRREGDELHFHLLRCSTNLSGPTEDFAQTDRSIVDALNQEAAVIFRDHAPLNHVLAQIYPNTPADAGRKQTKAKISAHADKTKDMPVTGIMAFCTFYDRLDGLSPSSQDAFDHGVRGQSALTRLHFRLKEHASPGLEPLPPEFTLTLYPDSVFFMPLSTNRLYTHEIQSSILNPELLPTRLGYVVRCSKTEAVHQQGRTFLKVDGRQVPLEPTTPEGMAELRRLYAEENKTDAFIDYGDRFLFSMNGGDYLAPECKNA
jgi:hypothetical protein